jgi:hypothetical protein
MHLYCDQLAYAWLGTCVLQLLKSFVSHQLAAVVEQIYSVAEVLHCISETLNLVANIFIYSVEQIVLVNMASHNIA